VSDLDPARISSTGHRFPCSKCGRTITAKPKTPSRPPVAGAPAAPRSTRPSSRRPSEAAAQRSQSQPAAPPRPLAGDTALSGDDDLPFESYSPAGDEDSGLDIDALLGISVEEEYGWNPSPKWIAAVLAAALAIAVALIVVLSRPPAPPPTAQDRIDQTRRGLGSAYFSPEARQVLERMRNKIRRDNYEFYMAEPGGPERVILRGLLAACGRPCPEEQELRARLAPTADGRGFVAEMTCGVGQDMDVRYLWTNNTAWIDGQKCADRPPEGKSGPP
jgi:hypothetical protein